VCGERITPVKVKGLPVSVLSGREFQYSGMLPREIALALVKWSEGLGSSPGMLINGKTVVEFVESL
jgi:hypothetical protein